MHVCSNMTCSNVSILLHAFHDEYHDCRLFGAARSHANAVNIYKKLHPERSCTLNYVY